MQDKGTFISPFLRPRCLAAAAPAGKAKLTHPGKAILAGKFLSICYAEKSSVRQNAISRIAIKSQVNKTVIPHEFRSLSKCLFLVRIGAM